MTDKDKLLSLLQDFGIGYVDKKYHQARGNWDDNSVVLYEDVGGGVQGYMDFYCKFDFDEQGKFISVGVWE